jgi:cyclic 2,3-diphosphoglycerate synthetase
MKVIALIDGEHHPAVARAALDRLAAEHELVAVLFVGGEEKIAPAVFEDPDSHYGRDVVFATGPRPDALRPLATGGVEAVFDLSGEPVLGLEERLRLASVALALGLSYRAPGLELDPPSRPRLDGCPVLAVIGTGKRTGKTAVGSHFGALVRERGADAVIVSMGRGGPARPQLVRAGETLDLARLLGIVRAGEHAASDYLEDAIVSGLTCVGCRRCGEGPAGETFDSTVEEGVRLALSLSPQLLLIEGSGAALPPLAADRTVCVTSAPRAAREALSGLGPFRLLRSHLVVITGAETLAAGELAELKRALGEWRDPGALVACRLEPEPIGRLVGGARAAFFATAPEGVELLRDRLAAEGVELCLASANLARRSELGRDLATAARERCDLFLTELKAAAIELVGEEAQRRGVPLALVRNRPVSLPGEPDLDERLERLYDEARAGARAEPATAALEER